MSGQTTLEPTPDSPAAPRRLLRRPGARALGLMIGSVAGVAAAALVVSIVHGMAEEKTPTTVPASWSRPSVDAAGLVQRSGVKITQLAVTGGGGLVDLRYQVVDADKANALHQPSNPPALVEEETGLVINQLLMDHSHTGRFTVGQTYYLIFENPNTWVHRGSKVTVLLGDAEVEHVTVR